MKNTLKLLLVSTACLTVSGCYDEGKSSGDGAQGRDHMAYVYEAQKKLPLNVKTVSGSYLVAQHAQFVNDWDVASQYLNRVLAEKRFMAPEDKGIFEKRAMVLNLGAGKIDEALFYAKSFKEDAENPLSLLVLSIPHIEKGEFAKAREIIDRMSKGGMTDLIKPVIMNWVDAGEARELSVTGSGSSQELYHLILAADYTNSSKNVKAIIDEGFDKEGMNLQSLINVADIYVRHGFDGRALSLYQQVEDQMPENEELKEKVATLKAGKSISEDLLFKAIPSPSSGVARSVLDIGMLLFQEKSYDSAKIFAHIALRLDPNLEDASLLLAYVSTQYEQYEQAIDFFSEIPESDEERYYQAQLQIADLQESSEAYDDALQTLESLSEHKNDIELQVRIGDVARSDEKYKRALKAYNNAFTLLEEDEDSVPWSLYYSRGIVYERLDDWNKAEVDLKRALELEPNHPYVLNYLGYSWADQGKNLEQAQEMIIKAVELQPEDGYIVDSLGWVYFKLEKYSEAIKPLETAVELMPEDPTINDHLGDAYWKVGRKHEAKFQWTRALNFVEDQPDNLSEVEALELIETLTKKIKSGL